MPKHIFKKIKKKKSTQDIEARMFTFWPIPFPWSRLGEHRSFIFLMRNCPESEHFFIFFPIFWGHCHSMMYGMWYWGHAEKSLPWRSSLYQMGPGPTFPEALYARRRICCHDSFWIKISPDRAGEKVQWLWALVLADGLGSSDLHGYQGYAWHTYIQPKRPYLK